MERKSAVDRRLYVLGAAVLVLAVVVFVVLLGSGGDDEPEVAAAGDCPAAEKPAAKEVSLAKPKPGSVLAKGEAARAVVETSCGSFTIELDTEQAPVTSNSFAYLAEEGVFEDTYFHRIVPGFVIQGGDPAGSGMGGPGYSVVEAPPADFRYEPGVVAMAKTGSEKAGTSGSQFFVVTEDASHLTPDYAVVGKVIDGMDVVEKIGKLGDDGGSPTSVVTIDSVRIERG
jgi:peptidyl-prolyl cis-trans isomerase B (cyclophilin B)